VCLEFRYVQTVQLIRWLVCSVEFCKASL